MGRWGIPFQAPNQRLYLMVAIRDTSFLKNALWTKIKAEQRAIHISKLTLGPHLKPYFKHKVF
jgi:hypothetical protein